MYPAEIVIPMKAELTNHGFKDLATPEQVETALNQAGTTFIVINSVCGCSAGSARPAALMAIENAAKKPTHLATTFAGFDMDAVQVLREKLLPYPPSSPSMALFKDGEVVAFVERHMIEGRPAQVIANALIQIFEEHC